MSSAAPLGLLGLLGLVVSSCARQSTASDAAGATLAEPPRVARADFQSRLLLTGELAAEQAAMAVAPMVRIWPLQVRWVAEDGIQVAAGDRLMELDNTQLLSRLEDLRSRIVEAASKLDQEQARAATEVSAGLLGLERSRAALRQAEIRAAVPEGILAAKQLAERQKELEVARLGTLEAETTLAAKLRGGAAAVAAARLLLASAERELGSTEANLDRLVVRAPRAGILLVAPHWEEPRPIREGDPVWPGMTLARIPDLSTLVVHAQVYDVDDGLVAPGMKVRGFLDAFPGRPLGGRVRAVERIAQPLAVGSLRRAFQAVVDLDRLDRERMRPGMSVRLEVALPVRGALTVPRSVVQWRGGAPFLRLADGTTTAVRLGPCGADRCALQQGPPEGTALARRTPRAGT